MRSLSPTVVAVVAALALAAPVASVVAQQRPKAPVITVSSTVASTDVYLRAQRLVAQGLGDAGRVIVDSALAAATEGSAAYAEGLFWRASLAATAADAERDYRVLAVEYSMSPRASDALLRLAQLELARGDRPEALRHLERLVLEHPTSPVRPRASYWMARVYFDGGDAPRACAALDAARANAGTADVETRNQVDYYAPRCQGVARQLAGGLPSPPPPATPATPAQQGAAPPAASGSMTSSVTSSVAVSTTPAKTPAATPASGAGESPFAGAATADASAPASTPTPTPTPPAIASTPAASTPAASPVAASPVVASPVVASPAAAPPALATAAPARRTVYAVQIAAYDAVAPAEALVGRLRARGIDARVSGSAAPFRVRVGRYATSAEAERQATSLKRRGQSAWVVTEQPTP